MNTAYRTVIAHGGKNPFKGAKAESMIEVHQRGANGRFRVVYGLQVRDGLTYADAAHELGECMFHLAACNGDLGNEGP